jgi:hypothetical protein
VRAPINDASCALTRRSRGDMIQSWIISLSESRRSMSDLSQFSPKPPFDLAPSVSYVQFERFEQDQSRLAPEKVRFQTFARLSESVLYIPNKINPLQYTNRTFRSSRTFSYDDRSLKSVQNPHTNVSSSRARHDVQRRTCGRAPGR